MKWWLKRTKGRHAASRAAPYPDTPVQRAAADLKETIMRRPQVDKLALRVRREFGVRP